VDSNQFTIIYEDEAILVVVKPRGLATAPLAKDINGNNLTKLVFNYCPAIALVQGFSGSEGGLLHRLDNATEGLVLYAKEQSSFDFLLNEAKLSNFKKYYLAYSLAGLANLNPDNIKENNWQILLNKNKFGNFKIALTTGFVKAKAKSSKVRAVGLSGSLKATKPYLSNFTLNSDKDFIKIDCFLTQGFRHQIRASLAVLGLPIINDPLYNAGNCKGTMQFWATALAFKHPSGEQLFIDYEPVTNAEKQ